MVDRQDKARNTEARRSQKQRGGPNLARNSHQKVTRGQVRGHSSAKSPSQPAPGQLTRGTKAGRKKPGRAGSAIPVQRQHPETRSERTRQKQPQRRKKWQGGTAGADGRLGVGVRSRDADITDMPVWQLGTEDRDTEGTAGHTPPRGRGGRGWGSKKSQTEERARGAQTLAATYLSPATGATR